MKCIYLCGFLCYLDKNNIFPCPFKGAPINLILCNDYKETNDDTTPTPYPQA
jgi:hypothetical protein